MYPGRYVQKPPLHGAHYQHVFGTTTSATESFLLSLGIKGPQWLQVTGVTPRRDRLSFCAFEFEVPDCANNFPVLPERSPPPLRALSLSLATLTLPASNQTIVCAASVAVFDGIAVDHETEGSHRKPLRRYCVSETRRSDV